MQHHFNEQDTMRIMWLFSQATEQRRGSHQIMHPTLAAANPLTIMAMVYKGHAELTVMINDTKLFYPDTMAFRVYIHSIGNHSAEVLPSMYKDDDIGIIHGCTWSERQGHELPLAADHFDFTIDKISAMLDVVWRRYKLPRQKEESCTTA